MTETSPASLSAVQAKVQLRREIRRRRQQLTPHYRAQAMRAIARHASAQLRKGRRIGAYLASGSELDLDILLNQALWRKANIYLPQIPQRGRRLWFSRVGAANLWYLHPRYHIIEYAGPRLRAEQLDILLIPLLAVDPQGYRMGQGGGFYDTSLAFKLRHPCHRRPLLVGVAYDCQRVAQLPRERWDIQLDYLLTESGWHRFAKS
ncbi:5-formyltetrahydrofolate cyclo-ligase [Neisseriaceae bacterium TC5R-5]|nr:5-formyltetrahydrofolate cyclo-ligase [Neisseriaceae bacterium TC5R-5]